MVEELQVRSWIIAVSMCPFVLSQNRLCELWATDSVMQARIGVLAHAQMQSDFHMTTSRRSIGTIETIAPARDSVALARRVFAPHFIFFSRSIPQVIRFPT